MSEAEDAQRLAAGIYLRQAIAGFLADPIQSPHRAGFLERFKLEQREGGYHHVLLLAADGELLLTTETAPAVLSSLTQEAIVSAVADPDAVVSGFFHGPARTTGAKLFAEDPALVRCHRRVIESAGVNGNSIPAEERVGVGESAAREDAEDQARNNDGEGFHDTFISESISELDWIASDATSADACGIESRFPFKTAAPVAGTLLSAKALPVFMGLRPL